MTRTEQEQELVLGNKQLLSAFFVVVALLGVFFTAGYIIGRNTGAKTVIADAASNSSPASEAARRTAEKTIETQPQAAVVRETAPAAIAQTDKTEEPAVPQPVEKPVAKPSAEVLGAVAAQVTPGHQYLQLMAVKRPVADNMVKLLKGRGYPALLGESSKAELFRVLVGPFTDTVSLAKTKGSLKAAGFDSVVAK